MGSGMEKDKEEAYKTLGYEFKQKIGVGGFAVVYLAQSSKYANLVAIKLIEVNLTKKRRLQYLTNELNALERLKHENIVQLFEHFLLNNTIHIVMEYCQKGSLGGLLRKNRQGFDEEYTRGLFIQMSKAIHYMHTNGIAHRDLKLNNVLLANDFTCKVADFGLAVVSFNQDTGVIYSRSYCGTKPYMAPEILQKRFIEGSVHDPMKSDVWALGVMLFTMLVGQYPFDVSLLDVEGPERWRILIGKQQERKWRWTKRARRRVSQTAKDLMQHLMDADVLKRITMVGVLAHPWTLRVAVPKTLVVPTEKGPASSSIVASDVSNRPLSSPPPTGKNSPESSPMSSSPKEDKIE